MVRCRLPSPSCNAQHRMSNFYFCIAVVSLDRHQTFVWCWSDSVDLQLTPKIILLLLYRGNDFLKPLIILDQSILRGGDNAKKISEYVAKGENVVILSNHQTEADPQVCTVSPSYLVQLVINIILKQFWDLIIKLKCCVLILSFFNAIVSSFLN